MDRWFMEGFISAESAGWRDVRKKQRISAHAKRWQPRMFVLTHSDTRRYGGGALEEPRVHSKQHICPPPRRFAGQWVQKNPPADIQSEGGRVYPAICLKTSSTDAGGWTEGVTMMVEGERTRFWVPEPLAYKGEAGSPKGMLVFDIDLVEIKR